MKKYAFSLHIEQHFEAPISKHSFILRCMPGTHSFQRSYAHNLHIKPYTALSTLSDGFGNEMFSGTIDKAHTAFTVDSSGFVLASKYLSHDPLDRMYLHPTNATQYTPGMRLLIDNTALPSSDFARAMMLCKKTSTILTLTDTVGHRSAAETLSSGRGNATEIGHVFLALCRLAKLPARLVSGLAIGHTGIHTWAEVYCGNTWRAFDPTKGSIIDEGYLKIAHGPDYDACSIERCCFRSPETAYTEKITATVTEHVVLTRDTVPHA